MDNLQIFDMTFDDFYKLVPIYNSKFDDFWKPSILKSELENINSKYIVAKLDNTVVGFAGIWFSVDDAHITNIAVHKDFRHNGIGSILLEELIKLAKQHNKSSLTLEVSTKNEYAQKLYEKYNFENLGIRKKYYDGIQDAYIMTLYF